MLEVLCAVAVALHAQCYGPNCSQRVQYTTVAPQYVIVQQAVPVMSVPVVRMPVTRQVITQQVEETTEMVDVPVKRYKYKVKQYRNGTVRVREHVRW